MTHPLDTDFDWTMERLNATSARYLDTIAGLSDEEFASPSVLPGWTVAHVISHVASNATGIERGVLAAMRGDDVPWVYETNEGRDREIEQRAGWPVGELRALNGSSVDQVHDAFVACPVDKRGVLLPRVIDGPAWSVMDWIGARWREVEIHHTDMGVGYTHQDWSDDFVAYLTKVAVFDREPEINVTLQFAEGGSVDVGAGGAVISGAQRDVIWWLIGRGGGHGVSGELPTLGPWQRRTRA